MNLKNIEDLIGISRYLTVTLGIGGRIRCFPEDFLVEEILTDGSKASLKQAYNPSPEGWGRYLLCLLIKKDTDTIYALERIAKELGIMSSMIRAAGIKDARALTAQFISVGMVTPEKVLSLNIKGLKIVPVRFEKEALSSRNIYGNSFRVTIRDIRISLSYIEAQIKAILNEIYKLGGIPNFFGHQRFGTVRPITHLVGRYIIKGNVEKAAITFLAKPSQYENPRTGELRRRLEETGDYKEALKRFPRGLIYERRMLSHLVDHPRDYIGAFRKLPIQLRRLFIHAYQSYLYNRFLSERMKRGISLSDVTAGDYILKLDQKGLPTNEISKISLSTIRDAKCEVKMGRAAVALPLVGSNIKLSGGLEGEIEQEILEEEDVSPKDFNVKVMPELKTHGSFRRIMAPVLNFKIYEVSEDVITSKFKVKIGFTLQRGSYATILLREIMKPLDVVKAGY